LEDLVQFSLNNPNYCYLCCSREILDTLFISKTDREQESSSFP